jgi:thioredoxin reductase (NADPH)
VGRGIYYGAASAEAPTCRDEEVYLVGGGNSSGQAAMLLSQYARGVTLVAPEADFAEKMSHYLMERLEERGNVHFMPRRSVVGAGGDGHLEEITLEDVETGEQETRPTTALFVFIGASPRTEWLRGAVALDDDGFVLAGDEVGGDGWPLERTPDPLESSLPGVFVAGDVRAGSVKRIGAAVGEGSSAIQFIHGYLAGR